jgi:uncharacterized protein YbjT (DUF2867 family)
MANETILITGVTGNQGGAVARALVDQGFKLRGLTRNPESDKARDVAKLGIEMVKGDLDDVSSVKAALNGAWGTFAVQNTWEAGVAKEEEQGKAFARIAREAGVQHFVYTSVGSAHRKTGIPHFENKWRIEEVVRGLEFPSHVILRPVFFMENLPSPWFLQGDSLVTALKPETKLQMVAVEDIGRIGAQAFIHADKLRGREIDLAGDEVTMPDTAAYMSRATARRIEYKQIAISEIRKNSEDFALMLEWFDKVGYNADIEALEKEFGSMTRLDIWVAEHMR